MVPFSTARGTLKNLFHELAHEGHHRIWAAQTQQNIPMIAALDELHSELLKQGGLLNLNQRAAHAFGDCFGKKVLTITDLLNALSGSYGVLSSEEFWVRLAESENQPDRISKSVAQFFNTIKDLSRSASASLCERMDAAERFIKTQRLEAEQGAKADLQAIRNLKLLSKNLKRPIPSTAARLAENQNQPTPTLNSLDYKFKWSAGLFIFLLPILYFSPILYGSSIALIAIIAAQLNQTLSMGRVGVDVGVDPSNQVETSLFKPEFNSSSMYWRAGVTAVKVGFSQEEALFDFFGPNQSNLFSFSIPISELSFNALRDKFLEVAQKNIASRRVFLAAIAGTVAALGSAETAQYVNLLLKDTKTRILGLFTIYEDLRGNTERAKAKLEEYLSDGQKRGVRALYISEFGSVRNARSFQDFMRVVYRVRNKFNKKSLQEKVLEVSPELADASANFSDRIDHFAANHPQVEEVATELSFLDETDLRKLYDLHEEFMKAQKHFSLAFDLLNGTRGVGGKISVKIAFEEMTAYLKIYSRYLLERDALFVRSIQIAKEKNPGLDIIFWRGSNHGFHSVFSDAFGSKYEAHDSEENSVVFQTNELLHDVSLKGDLDTTSKEVQTKALRVLIYHAINSLHLPEMLNNYEVSKKFEKWAAALSYEEIEEIFEKFSNLPQQAREKGVHQNVLVWSYVNEWMGRPRKTDGARLAVNSSKAIAMAEIEFIKKFVGQTVILKIMDRDKSVLIQPLTGVILSKEGRIVLNSGVKTWSYQPGRIISINSEEMPSAARLAKTASDLTHEEFLALVQGAASELDSESYLPSKDHLRRQKYDELFSILLPDLEEHLKLLVGAKIKKNNNWAWVELSIGDVLNDFYINRFPSAVKKFRDEKSQDLARHFLYYSKKSIYHGLVSFMKKERPKNYFLNADFDGYPSGAPEPYKILIRRLEGPNLIDPIDRVTATVTQDLLERMTEYTPKDKLKILDALSIFRKEDVLEISLFTNIPQNDVRKMLAQIEELAPTIKIRTKGNYYRHIFIENLDEFHLVRTVLRNQSAEEVRELLKGLDILSYDFLLARYGVNEDPKTLEDIHIFFKASNTQYVFKQIKRGVEIIKATYKWAPDSRKENVVPSNPTEREPMKGFPSAQNGARLAKCNKPQEIYPSESENNEAFAQRVATQIIADQAKLRGEGTLNLVLSSESNHMEFLHKLARIGQRMIDWKLVAIASNQPESFFRKGGKEKRSMNFLLNRGFQIENLHFFRDSFAGAPDIVVTDVKTAKPRAPRVDMLKRISELKILASFVFKAKNFEDFIIAKDAFWKLWRKFRPDQKTEDLIEIRDRILKVRYWHKTTQSVNDAKVEVKAAVENNDLAAYEKAIKHFDNKVKLIEKVELDLQAGRSGYRLNNFYGPIKSVLGRGAKFDQAQKSPETIKIEKRLSALLPSAEIQTQGARLVDKQSTPYLGDIESLKAFTLELWGSRKQAGSLAIALDDEVGIFVLNSVLHEDGTLKAVELRFRGEKNALVSVENPERALKNLHQSGSLDVLMKHEDLSLQGALTAIKLAVMREEGVPAVHVKAPAFPEALALSTTSLSLIKDESLYQAAVINLLSTAAQKLMHDPVYAKSVTFYFTGLEKLSHGRQQFFEQALRQITPALRDQAGRIILGSPDNFRGLVIKGFDPAMEGEAPILGPNCLQFPVQMNQQGAVILGPVFDQMLNAVSGAKYDAAANKVQRSVFEVPEASVEVYRGHVAPDYRNQVTAVNLAKVMLGNDPNIIHLILELRYLPIVAKVAMETWCKTAAMEFHALMVAA